MHEDLTAGEATHGMGGEIKMDERLAVRPMVEAFLADYIHMLDSDRLEDWASFFTEDGVYRVTTRENVEQNLPLSLMSCQGHGMFVDRITALRTANIFEPHVYCHSTSALRITSVSQTQIEAESTFNVIRTMADGTMSLFTCGRTRDRFSRQADGLKLAERVVILDSRQIDTLLVIPL